uniref:Si:dkey-57a22.14 n=2 Tax=Astyanax mexicanus TaxID=7994 RepID=A0A3B1JNY1_ASTMX
IIFYEDKKFGGHYYECSSDCADMLSYLKCCNSIKVEDGCFMVYEQPQYSGQQYFLSKGEYPEYQEWAGLNDLIGSCRVIPKAKEATFEMQLFERMEYGGQMMDLADDCPNVVECFHTSNIFSCKVIGGNWLFFEK